jgi:2-polyprenyl-3-methyl-5-hydroxy-6-metoxy-1,4-benzoquinol methylase
MPFETLPCGKSASKHQIRIETKHVEHDSRAFAGLSRYKQSNLWHVCEIPSVSVTIAHAGGEVRIEDIPPERRRITVALNEPTAFMPVASCTTAYPVELIRHVLEVKGPAYLCDEILRDEDPASVQACLEADLLSYVDAGCFDGKAILDYGCGCGASTMVLARMFPTASITGIDIDPKLIDLARARAAFYGLPRIAFGLSPNGQRLPEGSSPFDFIVLSAVYEHLLPAERPAVLAALWGALRPGGVLFLDQTPHRYAPVENHTTGLPLVNYLPDRATYWAARRLSRRVGRGASWQQLLRDGIRGATAPEVLSHIRRAGAEPLILLEPSKQGCRDRIDLWYSVSAGTRLRRSKRVLKAVLKGIKYATGLVLVPNLSLAIRKSEGGSSERGTS